MNPNITKILLRTLILSVTLGILFYTWFIIEPDLVRNFDFTAFINGANIVKSGSGDRLYDIRNQKEFLYNLVNKETPIVFRNPPTLTLLYMPFTFLPLSLSYKLIATLLLVIAFYSAKLMSGIFRKTDKGLVVLATVFFIPAALSILTGQPSFPLLVIWILIIGRIVMKKEFAAGVLTGLLFNKPQYLLIAPFLLFFVSDKKRYLIGLILTILLQVMISGCLVGFHNLPTYLYFLKDTEAFIYGSDPYSQISLSALLYNISRIVGILRGREYIIISILYIAILLYFKISYSPKNRTQLLFALPLLILTLSPHVWDYDLVLVLPSFFYLLSFSKKQELNIKIAPQFVAILLYIGWIVRFSGFPYLISLILLFTAIYIIKQQKPGLLSI